MRREMKTEKDRFEAWSNSITASLARRAGPVDVRCFPGPNRVTSRVLHLTALLLVFSSSELPNYQFTVQLEVGACIRQCIKMCVLSRIR